MTLNIFKTPTLDNLAQRYRTDKSSREHNFAVFYDSHFSKWRHEPIRFLEIGVGRGSSIRMWKKYFRKGTLFGIDGNPKKGIYRFYGAKIFIGYQEDGVFLHNVMKEIGKPDIIIDDGSHRVPDQQITLGTLFPYLKPGGYYVIEDLQTSFLNAYEGLDFGVLPDETNSTYGMLEQYKTTGSFQSQHLPQDQINYLNENSDACELYFHIDKRKHATSMIHKKSH